MATVLKKLIVSLTKHGAHKIAFLLQKFDKDDILNHLKGDYMDIHIDSAQTRGILSINQAGIAPDLWNDIKKYGLEDVMDLVFVAIVFSHHDYIDAFKKGISEKCVIKRGDVIYGKAYTNFAYIIEQFGFAIDHTSEYISFDISRIFHKFYVPELVAKLLVIKLTEAGWDKQNTLVEECVRLDLNSVFGLNPTDFKDWLIDAKEFDDQQLEVVKSKRNFKSGIRFKAGHNPKFEGEVDVRTQSQRKATLIHNKIQTAVYKILLGEFGQHAIGTEVKTNNGSVDIVRKTPDSYIFYEIKTSSSVKSNIRQGLSQLLEYAYWGEAAKVSELIIIGPCQSNDPAKKYLEKLRTEFNIPVFYRYYNPDRSVLAPKE